MIRNHHEIRVRTAAVVLALCTLSGLARAQPAQTEPAPKSRTLLQAQFRHCFDRLESKDGADVEAAFQEIAKLPLTDLVILSKQLPAEVIVTWLSDRRTSRQRYTHYGIMLGSCGTAEHGKFLRTMIGELVRHEDADIVGLLIGHVMLQPREGWGYVTALQADNAQPTQIRADAWLAARFFYGSRPDLIDAKDWMTGLQALLGDPAKADFAVDCLRQGKAWDQTERVLALFDRKKDFDSTAIRRSVVRFALRSPRPAATTFIANLRTSNPAAVRLAEDFLRNEEASEGP